MRYISDWEEFKSHIGRHSFSPSKKSQFWDYAYEYVFGALVGVLVALSIISAITVYRV